jgi:transaldolase
MTPSTDQLRVKVFADGADLPSIITLAENPLVQGFTTNPTLMRKAGVTDYAPFAQEVLGHIGDRPISFEVFSDDFDEMEQQAKTIASWGANVYVKIPVSNTKGDPSLDLITKLSDAGINLNVTALMTPKQVAQVAERLTGGPPACISLFAGRIADTGRDPIPLVEESLAALDGAKNLELIWASPREVLNVFQADQTGCHIITVTSDVLAKLAGIGRDLDEFSLDTVRMFHSDAQAAGYRI